MISRRSKAATRATPPCVLSLRRGEYRGGEKISQKKEVFTQQYYNVANIFFLLLKDISNYDVTYIFLSPAILPLQFTKMRKDAFLKKGFEGILVLWFLVCILPGDCLLLGCAGNDVSPCSENKSAVVPHADAGSCIPPDGQHCPNCCMLCAHNLVMHISQNSSSGFADSPSLLAPTLCSHSNSIFQTIIYHPPRLTT